MGAWQGGVANVIADAVGVIVAFTAQFGDPINRFDLV